MHQSKLIKLLKILRPDEFRMFYKFVRSIYYQNNTYLVHLYEILRKHYPDFPPSKIKKEKIFQQLFPNRNFNANALAGLMKKMTRLIEEYLLVLELRENPLERKKRLIQILGKRNEFKLFKMETKKLLAVLEQKSSSNHSEKIDLYHGLYFHPLHDKYDSEDETLEKLVDNLDQNFVLKKLRYGIALKSKQKILSKPYHFRFMELLIKESEMDLLTPSVLFPLYQSAFALLEEKGNIDFNKFDSLFFENIDKLDKEDQLLLYINGLNYINRQVNKGNSFFSSTAFRWYKKGLVNHLLVKNEKIDETTFSNIVVYGCREKEFDWTQNFIKDFQIFLPSEITADVSIYNQAWMFFSMRNFEKALSILSDYSFKEKDQPKTRLTIIRILFELFLKDKAYYNVLTSNIHSFEVLIFRNTFFKKDTLKPYLNAIRVIRGLSVRLHNGESNEKIRAWFLRQTQSKSQIIAIQWISEKVEAL